MWLAFALWAQVLAPETDHLCDVAARFVRQPRAMVERTAAGLGIARTWTDDEVQQVAVTFGLRLLEFPELTPLASPSRVQQYNTQFRERVQTVANGGTAPALVRADARSIQQNWAACEWAGY